MIALYVLCNLKPTIGFSWSTFYSEDYKSVFRTSSVDGNNVQSVISIEIFEKENAPSKS